MKRALLVLALLALPQFASGQALEEQIRTVLPTKKESAWLDIPWEKNIQRARLRSQKTGKPMLVWIMNGHVLGAT